MFFSSLFFIPWIFVIASLIATIGNAVSVIQALFNMKKDMSNAPRLGSIMFIKVAICESIPIILICLGASCINSLKQPLSIFIPCLLIIFFWFICSFFIASATRQIQKELADKNANETIIKYSMIGHALVATFPIISIFFLNFIHHA